MLVPLEAAAEADEAAELDSLACTCDARVAAWYLVPLAVTTNGKLAAAPDLAAEPAAGASGAAAA